MPYLPSQKVCSAFGTKPLVSSIARGFSWYVTSALVFRVLKILALILLYRLWYKVTYAVRFYCVSSYKPLELFPGALPFVDYPIFCVYKFLSGISLEPVATFVLTPPI